MGRRETQVDAAGEQTMLLLGGRALSAAGLEAASRVAAATGARVLAETFPARMEAGAGVPATRRLAYLAEQAEQQLDGVRTLVLAGAASPVSFFAYPGRGSDLVPDGCQVVLLAEAGQDVEAALVALADRVATDTAAELATYGPPAPEPRSAQPGEPARGDREDTARRRCGWSWPAPARATHPARHRHACSTCPTPRPTSSISRPDSASAPAGPPRPGS